MVMVRTEAMQHCTVVHAFEEVRVAGPCCAASRVWHLLQSRSLSWQGLVDNLHCIHTCGEGSSALSS
jgi:hypothetical protein